jgi:ABC-type branched-subunit amino acid transport system ATPase component
METGPLLRVNRLRKSFGGVLAAYDLSFDLKQGEFVGVIGPNGSGKTTLVNLITGFVKPIQGSPSGNITGKMSYTIAGWDFTFQMVRLFTTPGIQNLIIPLCSSRSKKPGGKWRADDIAIDLLDDMGWKETCVPYKVAASPHGYLKRQILRGSALRPEVLILDELFSGMSMSEVASTLPLIEKFNEEGLSIIMIEHRLKELFRVVDRVIVLNFGMKIADGSPSEVMNSEEVKKAYLGIHIDLV